MRFFSDHPDPRCVSLLLNCFGEGDGHGIYQLMDNVIRPFPDDVVLPALKSALEKPGGSVRFWCSQIAADRPHPTLENPLTNVLNEGDFDERYAAITALEAIGTENAKVVLQNRLEIEEEEELGDVIRDVLGKWCAPSSAH
ncbi:MAG: HEAT repeat domain-containing protein [Nitrospiraceae bacterium]|nr:HEAT repeat domain-containing protein [Nitrospiraceae bacterium]